MARQSQNIPVHQGSKSNCKMFRDFLHSHNKQTDKLSFSLKIYAIIVIAASQLKKSDLVFKSIYQSRKFFQ